MENISQLLSIQYPIIQAPMALADSPALAAAISNGGGSGQGGRLCKNKPASEVFQALISETNEELSKIKNFML